MKINNGIMQPDFNLKAADNFRSALFNCKKNLDLTDHFGNQAKID